jgi:hypothetical protein
MSFDKDFVKEKEEISKVLIDTYKNINSKIFIQRLMNLN